MGMSGTHTKIPKEWVRDKISHLNPCKNTINYLTHVLSQPKLNWSLNNCRGCGLNHKELYDKLYALLPKTREGDIDYESRSIKSL